MATQTQHLQPGGNGELINLGVSFKKYSHNHNMPCHPKRDLIHSEWRHRQRKSGWGLGVEGRWKEGIVGEEGGKTVVGM